MKANLRRLLFLSICVLLAASTAAPVSAQDDEADYQKSLLEAYAQSAPSEYRAQAMKKLLASLEDTRMSERALNQFVADKYKALMEIDFYAAFLAQSITAFDFIKWREVFELLPAEQVAAIKKLDQWKAGGGANKSAYPAGVPQPGYGWGKTVSSNTRPQNAPAARVVAAKPTMAATADPASPQTPDDYFKQGNRQMDNKDYEAAIKSFSECIRLNPKADGCYTNRGMAYRQQENYEAAIADYTEVIKLAPQNAGAYANRAVAYSKQENHEAAIADFEASLKINPDDENVKAALQATREYLEEKKQYVTNQEKLGQVGDDFLRQGNQQFGAKNWNEAIRLYTKCIEASPLNLECYNNRGLSYGAVKEYDKAIVDFSAILLLKPVPRIYFQRALAYRDKNDLEAALKDFTEAVKLAPDDAENYAERGGTYIFKNDFASAAHDLTQAIKLNPQEARYYFIRGYAYQLAQNKDSAIADYKKALQIEPGFAPAQNQLRTLGVQP